MIGVFDAQTTKPAVPSTQTNKPVKTTLPTVPTANTAADKNQKPPSLAQPYPDILSGRTAQEITNLQQIQHLAKEVVKVDENDEDDDNEVSILFIPLVSFLSFLLTFYRKMT